MGTNLGAARGMSSAHKPAAQHMDTTCSGGEGTIYISASPPSAWEATCSRGDGTKYISTSAQRMGGHLQLEKGHEFKGGAQSWPWQAAPPALTGRTHGTMIHDRKPSVPEVTPPACKYGIMPGDLLAHLQPCLQHACAILQSATAAAGDEHLSGAVLRNAVVPEEGARCTEGGGEAYGVVCCCHA